MNKRKKWVLHGWFGQNNLGDDLLLNEALNHISPDDDIYIYPGPYSDTDNYKRDIKYVRNYIDLIRIRPDISLYCGGGLFPTTTFRWRALFSRLLTSLFVSETILNGIGISPKLRFGDRLRFALFLKTCKIVTVRDSVSCQYVNSLPFVSQCQNIGDLYFGHKLMPLNKIGNNRKALICLANPFSDEEKGDSHFSIRYNILVSQIRELIKYIKNDYKQIDFLPFLLHSDSKFINDIKVDSELGDCNVLSLGINFSLDNIDELFCQYDFALCMRFHSIVLATRNQVPCLAICYDYKSSSLMHEAGLDMYAVNYGIKKNQFFGKEIDLNRDELFKCYERVQQNIKEIRKLQREYTEIRHSRVIESYKRIYSL